MAKDDLVVFQDKKIRRIWFNDEWWFVVEDIVLALIDSKDVKQYITKMRQRDELLNKGWVQIVHTLPIKTSGGIQSINCSNIEGIFRIIQSIPSPKAEPFKLWLARVGYERIQEIQNPELAHERAKNYYKMQGYSDEWINCRLRGISVRQELTDEWKKRGIKEDAQFAILTNEICQTIFGMSVSEYRKFKGLEEKNHNLRDFMSEWEVLFNMLGEKAAAEITKAKDAKGFEENKRTAKRGGKIAYNARKELEGEIGKEIVSKDKVAELEEKKK